MQLNQLKTLKFGNITKYFTEILFTLQKFLYLCTRDSVKAIKQADTKWRRMRPKVPYLTLTLQI